MVQKRFGNTPPSTPGALTIRDIARIAGVAPSTVSAVINGRLQQARISAATAQRVREAIERLGYHPDHVARSLRRGTTGLIGLAVSRLQDPFYPEFSIHFGEACRARGYAMFLTDLPDWESPAADEGLGKSLVDGVVLVDTRRSPWHPGRKVNDPAACPLPTVLVAGQEWLTAWKMPLSPHVLVLQTELAGRLAARHLWERGFRRFAYVSQTSPVELTPGHREYGFYDELRRLGAGDDAIRWAPLVGADVDERANNYLTSYLSAVALLQSGWCSGPERVGIYAVNDLAAMQVLRAVNEAGLAVPDRVGVIGTNGIQLGEATCPPLTSVSLNVAAVAEQAVARVLELVARRRNGERRPGAGASPGQDDRDRHDQEGQVIASEVELRPFLLLRQST